jgi:hypothetical protein
LAWALLIIYHKPLMLAEMAKGRNMNFSKILKASRMAWATDNAEKAVVCRLRGDESGYAFFCARMFDDMEWVLRA